jgi:hypothetical protein
MDQSKGTAKQTGSAKATRATAAKASQQQDPSSSSSAAAATPVDDEDLGGKAEDSDSTAPDAQSDASSAPDAKAHGGVTVAKMFEAMQAMQDELKELRKRQQPQSLSLGAASSSSGPLSDIAALIRAMQESSVQQAERNREQQEAAAELARKQQAATAAQLLLLQSLGELPTFTGKGGDTTLIAEEWLQRTEDFFIAREQALGIDAALGDQARLRSVATVLQDDARRWYSALPKRPTTWAEFQEAVQARFCSVPSERIRVDRLTGFVEKAFRLRDKLNVQGMQAFTARFAQLAGEVPDDLVTGRGKLALLSRGLPQRYAEVVLKEEAKKPTPPLHEVINTVLARASQREQAASYGGASTSSGSPIPINIDAISLAVATFGWTREEAGQHLSDGEGWAPYDTHGGRQGAPSSQGAGSASSGPQSPTTITSEQVTQLLAAFAAQSTRVGAGPAARGAHHWSGGSSNAKEVPADLARARQDAGLCIRCGVAKYEPGRDGHHARICQAPADKTTSAEDGIKQAGL